MTTIRAALAATFALGVLVAPLTAEAQQTSKVYRIVWLAYSGSPTGRPPAAFSEGLKELGYVEGKNTAAPELSAKRLQLLKEALPTVAKVAMLLNPENSVSALQWCEIESAAQPLRVKLLAAQAKSPREFENAFALMVREHAGALIVAGD